MDRRVFGPTKIPVTTINQHLVCSLCGGYYIDATTITECLHSFCRSCIVTHLQSSKYCPTCDVQVHKTRPLQHIRRDRTLQDLVYKLIPDLLNKENLRRKEFFKHKEKEKEKEVPEAKVKEEKEETVPLSEAKEEIKEEPEEEIRPPPNPEFENISLSLEFSPDGKPHNRKKENGRYPAKRYLLCSSQLSVRHIKKFIRMKFGLPQHYEVDVFHTSEDLNDKIKMGDIGYIYTWQRKEPLKLFYSVYTDPNKTGSPKIATELPESVKESVLHSPTSKLDTSRLAGLPSPPKVPKLIIPSPVSKSKKSPSKSPGSSSKNPFGATKKSPGTSKSPSSAEASTPSSTGSQSVPKITLRTGIGKGVKVTNSTGSAPMPTTPIPHVVTPAQLQQTPVAVKPAPKITTMIAQSVAVKTTPAPATGDPTQTPKPKKPRKKKPKDPNVPQKPRSQVLVRDCAGRFISPKDMDAAASITTITVSPDKITKVHTPTSRSGSTTNAQAGTSASKESSSVTVVTTRDLPKQVKPVPTSKPVKQAGQTILKANLKAPMTVVSKPATASRFVYNIAKTSNVAGFTIKTCPISSSSSAVTIANVTPLFSQHARLIVPKTSVVSAAAGAGATNSKPMTSILLTPDEAGLKTVTNAMVVTKPVQASSSSTSGSATFTTTSAATIPKSATVSSSQVTSGTSASTISSSANTTTVATSVTTVSSSLSVQTTQVTATTTSVSSPVASQANSKPSTPSSSGSSSSDKTDSSSSDDQAESSSVDSSPASSPQPAARTLPFVTSVKTTAIETTATTAEASASSTTVSASNSPVTTSSPKTPSAKPGSHSRNGAGSAKAGATLAAKIEQIHSSLKPNATKVAKTTAVSSTTTGSVISMSSSTGKSVLKKVVTITANAGSAGPSAPVLTKTSEHSLLKTDAAEVSTPKASSELKDTSMDSTTDQPKPTTVKSQATTSITAATSASKPATTTAKTTTLFPPTTQAKHALPVVNVQKMPFPSGATVLGTISVVNPAQSKPKPSPRATASAKRPSTSPQEGTPPKLQKTENGAKTPTSQPKLLPKATTSVKRPSTSPQEGPSKVQKTEDGAKTPTPQSSSSASATPAASKSTPSSTTSSSATKQSAPKPVTLPSKSSPAVTKTAVSNLAPKVTAKTAVSNPSPKVTPKPTVSNPAPKPAVSNPSPKVTPKTVVSNQAPKVTPRTAVSNPAPKPAVSNPAPKVTPDVAKPSEPKTKVAKVTEPSKTDSPKPAQPKTTAMKSKATTNGDKSTGGLQQSLKPNTTVNSKPASSSKPNGTKETKKPTSGKVSPKTPLSKQNSKEAPKIDTDAMVKIIPPKGHEKDKIHDSFKVQPGEDPVVIYIVNDEAEDSMDSTKASDTVAPAPNRKRKTNGESVTSSNNNKVETLSPTGNKENGDVKQRKLEEEKKVQKEEQIVVDDSDSEEPAVVQTSVCSSAGPKELKVDSKTSIASS